MSDLDIRCCNTTKNIQEPGMKYPQEKFPVLSGWMERMMKDKSVIDYHLDTSTHAAFLASMGSGSPNYNLLSQKESL